MPILTLLGAMAFALASAATLAFRVVRVPRSNAATRGPAGSQTTARRRRLGHRDAPEACD